VARVRRRREGAEGETLAAGGERVGIAAAVARGGGGECVGEIGTEAMEREGQLGNRNGKGGVRTGRSMIMSGGI
jgi:hypothetical protein